MLPLLHLTPTPTSFSQIRLLLLLTQPTPLLLQLTAPLHASSTRSNRPSSSPSSRHRSCTRTFFHCRAHNRVAMSSSVSLHEDELAAAKKAASLASHLCQVHRLIPTQKNIRMSEIYREVVALLKSIIEQREREIRNGEASTELFGIVDGVKPKPFLGTRNHLQDVRLTTEDVIEECKLFYFTGQETSSVLLTWTMIVLSMHPNWQDWAREEVLQVFGQNKPNFEGLNQLKIVTMILYEVLRLYPPGILLRETYKEVKLGEVNFPPQVQLILPIILLHHCKEFWGEDAEEFNPERFAEGVSKATMNQLIFFPFSWDHRICIGQAFALTEAKMVLARIL